MALHQHPLLHYYAKAASYISLASLAGPVFPPRSEVMEYVGMAVAALPPLALGEDRRHDEIRAALAAVASGRSLEGVPFEVQVRWRPDASPTTQPGWPSSATTMWSRQTGAALTVTASSDMPISEAMT
jgi:hypothetical protein